MIDLDVIDIITTQSCEDKLRDFYWHCLATKIDYPIVQCYPVTHITGKVLSLVSMVAYRYLVFLIIHTSI